MIPVPLELLRVRHPVSERSMLHEVEAVSLPFEFWRDHLVSLYRSDTERDKGRWHVNRTALSLKRSAHRILSADGSQPKLLLHLQSAEQSRRRLAPYLRIGCHPFKIFLARESHCLPMASRRHDLAASLDE